MEQKQNLPAIQDLYKGEIAELQNSTELNVLLNQPPKKDWVKTHPMHNDVKYLTIARIEYLLTALFIEWDIEVKQVQLIANSVVVTIRLHYKDQATGEMRWTDGVGAADIQTKQGASATDFSQINHSAVMKATPAAKSFAVKDAAHKLGNLFGADLNRKDEIVYDSLLKMFDPVNKLKKILSKKIAECQDPEVENEMMEEDIVNFTEEDYLRVLKKYFNYEPDTKG